MGKTNIEWTDYSWSPVRARIKPDAMEIASAKGYTSLVTILEARKPNGELRSPLGKVGPHCEHCSPGCEFCYSETNGKRCLPANGTGLPFDRRSRDLVDIFLDEKILMQPLRWKAPKRIFVNSQTDSFGEFVTDEIIDRMFAVAALTPQHTYQFLTKRAERMREWAGEQNAYATVAHRVATHASNIAATIRRDLANAHMNPWPLPNVWLGVSVEDQPRADERIPLLLQTPAAVRLLSVEPLLGPIRIEPWLPIRQEDGACRLCGFLDSQKGHAAHCTEPHVSLVIVGGESGPGARPMHPDWARSLRDQCVAAGVPFFFKQWGEAGPWDATEGTRPKSFILLKSGQIGQLEHLDRDTHPNQIYRPQIMARVGKKAAGRILDGRTWDEMPGQKSETTKQ